MPEKTELEIELLIPGVLDARDDCVQRLSDLIEARKGVGRVHFREVEGEQSNRLCIHFDPSEITLGEVRQFARQAGSDLANKYGHLLLATRPMSASRARMFDAQIENLPGILDAGVSPDGVIRVEFDKEKTDLESIRKLIRSSGIVIDVDPGKKWKQEHTSAHDHLHDPGDPRGAHEHRHGGLFGERTELIFAVVCGALLIIGWLLSWAGSLGPWISWTLFATAYLIGGYYPVREAIEKIALRRFEIDFLMIIAAIGAAILGEWAEGALLLFLFSLGHSLENYAMGRARKAIESLAELAPESAVVRRDGVVVEVPVGDLTRGDIVIVKTNERIAADGFVVKGSSTVNQSPITGESIPVDKRPVDDPERAADRPELTPPENRVFAGTINESGSLEIQVTHLASESTLAKVVTMVSEAETQQSPTQRFTNKFERVFVPTVIVAVVLLLFAFLVVNEPFSASFYRAMAVLVAASPCALAIATPSAVLSGVARAARGGVLIKGGGPLENLGRLSAIAFDKTGTLTEGKPRITDVVSFGGVTEVELLQLAIAVEQLSDHPLAAAVVRDGKERLEGALIPAAHNLQSTTGRGIQAIVEGQSIYIGKDDFFAEISKSPLPVDLQATVTELESNGRTTMIVRRDDQYLGVIGLMDTPRASARSMIANLRKLGIEQMVMISGDNQQVVDAVASEVGLDEAWGDLMPNEKVIAIKKLRAHRGVAMVGDGVNDAPAMANATVGIAMGAAGSDIALETADVALMADDLGNLPFAVGLSRQTSRIIRQNLWFSLGMIAILVPATIFGLRIGFAVLLHEGSTVAVVFNALRLLVYRKVRD